LNSLNTLSNDALIFAIKEAMGLNLSLDFILLLNSELDKIEQDPN